MQWKPVDRHHVDVTDPLAPSSEPVDPNPTLHAPPPTVGQASAVALEEPPLASPAEPPEPTPQAVPPASPPKRRRPPLPGLPPAWPLLLTAVVLFAAAIGFLVLIAIDPNPKSAQRHTATTPSASPPPISLKKLTAPHRINRYVALANAPLLKSELRAALIGGVPAKDKSLVDAFVDATAISEYRAPGVSSLLTLGAFPLPGRGGVLNNTTVIDQIFGLKNTTAKKAFPAGPHGGTLECGAAKSSGKPLSICIWADSTAIGALASEKPALSPSDLAELTNVARAQLEK